MKYFLEAHKDKKRQNLETVNNYKEWQTVPNGNVPLTAANQCFI